MLGLSSKHSKEWYPLHMSHEEQTKLSQISSYPVNVSPIALHIHILKIHTILYGSLQEVLREKNPKFFWAMFAKTCWTPNSCFVANIFSNQAERQNSFIEIPFWLRHLAKMLIVQQKSQVPSALNFWEELRCVMFAQIYSRNLSVKEKGTRKMTQRRTNLCWQFLITTADELKQFRQKNEVVSGLLSHFYSNQLTSLRRLVILPWLERLLSLWGHLSPNLRSFLRCDRSEESASNKTKVRVDQRDRLRYATHESSEVPWKFSWKVSEKAPSKGSDHFLRFGFLSVSLFVFGLGLGVIVLTNITFQLKPCVLFQFGATHLLLETESSKSLSGSTLLQDMVSRLVTNGFRLPGTRSKQYLNKDPHILIDHNTNHRQIQNSEPQNLCRKQSSRNLIVSCRFRRVRPASPKCSRTVAPVATRPRIQGPGRWCLLYLDEETSNPKSCPWKKETVGAPARRCEQYWHLCLVHMLVSLLKLKRCGHCFVFFCFCFFFLCQISQIPRASAKSVAEAESSDSVRREPCCWLKPRLRHQLCQQTMKLYAPTAAVCSLSLSFITGLVKVAKYENGAGESWICWADVLDRNSALGKLHPSAHLFCGLWWTEKALFRDRKSSAAQVSQSCSRDSLSNLLLRLTPPLTLMDSAPDTLLSTFKQSIRNCKDLQNRVIMWQMELKLWKCVEVQLVIRPLKHYAYHFKPDELCSHIAISVGSNTKPLYFTADLWSMKCCCNTSTELTSAKIQNITATGREQGKTNSKHPLWAYEYFMVPHQLQLHCRPSKLKPQNHHDGVARQVGFDERFRQTTFLVWVPPTTKHHKNGQRSSRFPRSINGVVVWQLRLFTAVVLRNEIFLTNVKCKLAACRSFVDQYSFSSALTEEWFQLRSILTADANSPCFVRFARSVTSWGFPVTRDRAA